MAVITPQSDVYLLKVPLEINDINQLTFANATAQYNYFNGLPKLAVTDFTYQRKDGTIRYGANFDSLLSYNYVMYRNDAFSNKWFYAFITGMEYLNDSVTAISIKTDVWQTYQFDLTFKRCLIDREHTNNDTRGANTLPEGLELGEFVCNDTVTNFGGVGGTGASDYTCVVEVAQVENDGEGATLSLAWSSGTHTTTPTMNSIYRGTTPLVLGMTNNSATTPSQISKVYDKAGLGEAIVNVYMIPKSLVPTYNECTITCTPKDGSASIGVTAVIPANNTGTIDMGTATFNAPTSIRGFTPKNNKLFCWQYCYFNISNNAGACSTYHYEDFQSTISFKTEGTFGVGGTTKTTPQNYKHVLSTENALDFSVTGPKYPVCSWKSDSYTNWLTQNAVNMNHEQIASAVKGGGQGLATAGGLLAAAGMAGGPISMAATLGIAGISALASASPLIGTVLEQQRAKTTANFTPDQVSGNTNAGDFLWAKYRSPFTFMAMSIKPEVAYCIDEFFSQYGYKCNRVKVPNITGRRNWNYVKTVGCYIQADIPQEDLQEIKSMFDKGITLWHNPTTFMDYSQTNDILT